MKKSNISTECNPSTPSWQLYAILVGILAFSAALSPLLPQNNGQPASPIPPWQLALASAGLMLVLYGGLGAIGLKLTARLGWPDLMNPAISWRQRVGYPALSGLVIGVIFIMADALFSRLHPLGPMPHPPFPTSILASISAGIGEEILFRLFLISFWTWLISVWLLKGRYTNMTFWIITGMSALAFAAAHLPSFFFLTGAQTITDLPPALLVEIFALNGLLSLAAAWWMRKAGFLAAVGVHFWADIIWHVIWGLVQVI